MGRVWMTGGGGGPDLDVITAEAGNVLSGKVIVDKDGNPLTGTMPNQGAKTASLNCGGSYTIPAGYHNGSGKVAANSLASQTDATATAALILSGYTAWAKGSKITGTMPNQGAKTVSLNCGGSYIIPNGYHNGGGKVTANSLASQTSANATAAQILASQTAWVNGTKITGTMTNRGTWNGSCGTNGSVTIPAGYHNGSGKVTNSQKTLAGKTITPSTSQQTIGCNGYLMTGNIVIGAIPSGYVNVASQGTFFSNGAYGPLADLGAYSTTWYESQKKWLSSPTLISASDLSSGNARINSDAVSTGGGMARSYVIFRRCIDISVIKRLVVSGLTIGASRINDIDFILLDSSMSDYTGVIKSTGSTIMIPSSIDKSKKYCVAFRCRYSSTMGLTSLIGYTS